MQAVDIVRQRGKDITAMMKVVHLAESFGVNVHGGDPHVVLATKNDPVFEAASWGTARVLTDAKLTFQGTAVVENGYIVHRLRGSSCRRTELGRDRKESSGGNLRFRKRLQMNRYIKELT